MGKKLRSKLLSVYVSKGARRRARAWHEAKRRLSGSSHTVTAFLQLDDPYSYLLSQYLPTLADHYDIDLQVRLSEALGGDFHPAPELLAEYAAMDCARVAAELGLPFLDKGSTPPVEHRRAMCDALATPAEIEPGEICSAIEYYWRGDGAAVARLAAGGKQGASEAVIAGSRQELQRLGHYGSAMLYYSGEWFWGIDRLHYLVKRLDEQGLASTGAPGPRLDSIQRAMQLDLPVVPPAAAKDLPPIDLFYSFRSPYSHLSVRRVSAVADAFGLDLVLRPVLPLMMRGVSVPRSKLRYILRDAAREAEMLGVPFGNAMDPFGKGVERCHAVFAYAQSERRAREFLQNASDLIWSEGVDAATDDGMRKITARTGLFWPEAKQAMESDDWREAAEENRQLMLSLGSWGVPTMSLGDYAVWGQDRIWLLARHLEELCDAGEGILV